MEASPFRTQFEIPPLEDPIRYPGSLMGMGSCFAEHMIQKLNRYKFEVLSNPLGILFNPISCAKGLEYLLGLESLSERQLILHEGNWVSLDHHGRFSASTKQELEKEIELSLEQGRVFLKNAQYILLTFGTAWVYRWKDSGEIVANCHKIPASRFEKVLLPVEAIVSRFEKILTCLNEEFPHLRLICTVSPIRHWKDGALNNQVSKSVLRLALFELQKRFDSLYYFPAYELLMDDLRDYRFYAPDMLHPNETAIAYVWERFKEACIHSDAHPLMEKVHKIALGLEHKPRDTSSEAYQIHLKKLLNSIKVLESEEACLNFESEKRKVEGMLNG